jgi:diguanylate cyclase (GGDEF)-like protein
MRLTVITKNTALADQVLPLFESTRSGALSNAVIAWLVLFIIKDSHLFTHGLVLSSIITILSLVRIFSAQTYLRTRPGNFSAYLAIQLAMIIIVGISWGLYALMQITQEDDVVRNMVLLVNFGLISASMATLAVWMPAYLAYMLPQVVAILAVSIIAYDERGILMFIGLMVYTMIMLTTSYALNRSNCQEQVIKQKNRELITSLNDEVQQRKQTQSLLEDSKHELEQKVKERTWELIQMNRDLEKEVEERQQAEKNLHYIAYHDELTGLPNKTLLVDRIDQAIEAANRYKQKLGILFLDLDRFKNINDSLGHIIGDKLIKQVAQRLHMTIRKEDTISRNGGDEFVIVIQRMTSSNEAVLVANKIIDNLTSIFDIDSHKIHIGASIGISVYPTDAQTALELLRNADTAMYRAKTSGGNRLQFYDESMSSQLRERLQLENELHTALQRDEYYMVYQPQVDCVTGETVGFEALLRWKNALLGNVVPDRFIPLLEETGLIYVVGEWVIKQVIQFIRDGHVGAASIAVNLSALQCKDTSLLTYIRNEVQNAGIDPSQLEFEITESLLINDFEKTEKFLQGLHTFGCTIALDDFGTGYTSMGYLSRLPIDIIKVDRMFVRNIDTNSVLHNIVNAIVKMSVSMGIRNVFEGVESDHELAVIRELNGNIIQGYYFSKPLNAGDVHGWLCAN